MILRFSRFVLCGVIALALGCQNALDRTARLGERDSWGTRFSLASDDPAGLETGRGHLPSLASEMADHGREAEDPESSKNPGEETLAVQRLLERGHEADSHGRVQEAKTYYEQVLSEQPHHPEAHHRLAILADRAGDFTAAELHYRTALRGKPDDADVLNDLGYSCFLQGRAADSKRYLNQALRINPRHPHVQENLSLLSDPAKAEKTLLTVLAPRQAQATLAQLFEGTQGGVPRQPISQPPRAGATAQEIAPIHSTAETSSGLAAAQRKMTDARPQNIAERQQQSAPAHQNPHSHQLAGLPQLPAHYPPQDPPQRGFGSSVDIPEGRITDVFHPTDNSGQSPGDSSQMTAPDQRAAAPQWNTPPLSWPQSAPETMPVQTSQPARHAEPASYPPSGSAWQSLPSAAQRAAEIGMAAGPGAIFPHIEDSLDSSTPRQDSDPAMRSLPGANSPMNAAMHQQPGGQSQPLGWDGQVHQPEAFAAQFGPAPQIVPGRSSSANGVAPASHEQTRSAPNAPFHHDQQSLSASPRLTANGPAGWETLPSSFDSSRQSGPAPAREQYDTRQMNQPPMLGQGNVGSQSLPQYNPALQQAPPNHGGGW